MRCLLASRLLATECRNDRPPAYAIDMSVWARCDAEASPGRGYYYHPSRHSAGQPIVAGRAYQLVAALGFERDSWVAPVDAVRVRPEEDANDVGAEQVKGLLGRLPGRSAPLFVFDAGYDPVRLQRSLEGQNAQILVRLHSGRAFYADPPTPERRPVGRPSVHGEKFDLKDRKTWHEPSAEHRSEGAGYGKVRVRAWSGLHPKTRRAGERYGSDSACVVRGTVVLVEVERLPRGEKRRSPQEALVMVAWRRRAGSGVAVEKLCAPVRHRTWVKLLKSSLGWTTPRVRHPEQADRWTWLVIVAYVQLMLARGIVADRRLPWERPLPIQSLTPTRILRSFATLLPTLGTPAKEPKPRGRSPGRPKGRLSGRAKRYPAVKKAA